MIATVPSRTPGILSTVNALKSAVTDLNQHQLRVQFSVCVHFIMAEQGLRLEAVWF